MKSTALGAFVAVFTFFGATDCKAQQDVRSFLAADVTDVGPQYQDVENAILAFRNNDAAAARKLLLAACEKHPQLAPADVMLARLHRDAGQNGLAQAALDRTVIDAPEDPEAYLMLGDIAFAQGQMSYAHVMFEKADRLLAQFDRNRHRKKHLQIRAHAGLAAVAETRGQWEVAQEQLVAWIALDGGNATAHGRLGRVYFMLKKYDEARVAFTRQRELDATAAVVELSLALLYADMGDKDEARRLIDAAVSASPEDVRTLYAAARWLLSDGQLEKAAKLTKQVLGFDEGNVPALILLGQIARCADDNSSAVKHLEAAVLAAPMNFEAKNQLALTLAGSDKPQAIERARQFAQLNAVSFSNRNTRPGREAAITLAWVIFQQGRETEAAATVASVLRAGAIGPESAYNAARILHDRGQTELAAEILKPMLKIAPMFPARSDAESLLAELNGKEKDAAGKP